MKCDRVVVPVLAGMGNSLMAQPMIRQLAAGLRPRELVVLARNASIAGVFDRLAEVTRIEVFGNEPRQFGRLLRRLRGLRADVLVVPYPSNRWQYSLLAAASGARRVVMHGYPVGRRRAMHDLVRNRVPARAGVHDVRQNLALLGALGIEADESMAPAFVVTGDEVEAARDRLRAVAPQLPPDSKWCAVHAGSGATVFAHSKRWPAARWAELVPRLREEFRLTPVLLEGPEDAGVGELVRAAADVPVLRLGGPLAEAAATLAACELYVGSDSGLAHLAAAVGTPPVTLFGPARPDEVCPFGFRGLVVRTPAPCAPCFRYPMASTSPAVACRPPYCIDRIDADAVMSRVAVATRHDRKGVRSAKPMSAFVRPGHGLRPSHSLTVVPRCRT